MANEATINAGLTIKTAGGLEYNSLPASFRANVSGNAGPSPGVVIAGPNGTIVTFPNLTNPSLCRIMNLDTENHLEVGIWTGTAFFPLIELLPAETFIIRLSRHLGAEYHETGTGSFGHPGSLMLKSPDGIINSLVEAFAA